jgi:hypothetical protein
LGPNAAVSSTYAKAFAEKKGEKKHLPTWFVRLMGTTNFNNCSYFYQTQG